MEQNNNLKKTLMGGFEKQSVMDYIENLSNKSASMEQSLNSKIKEMVAANDELTKKSEEMSKRIAELEQRLKYETERGSSLTEKIDKLNLDLLAQKKIEHELKKELEIKAEQNKQLTDKLNSASKKADRFDETAIDVGGLLIDAKSSADKIIGQAMADAKDIKVITNKNITEINAEIASFKKDINGLRENISTVVVSIAKRLDGLVASVNEIENRCKKISGINFEKRPAENKPKEIENAKNGVKDIVTDIKINLKEGTSSSEESKKGFSIFKN